MRTKVIAVTVLGMALLGSVWSAPVQAQTGLDKRLDSLFRIASSGEIKFKDMIKPADDSIVAMGMTVVPKLVSKLSTKSRYERIALERILKRFGATSVEPLLAVLKHDHGLVLDRACYVLGEIGDTSATLGLLAMTTHERWQTREQSVSALGKIGDHRADSSVISALADTIALVRKSAAVSCGQLKIQESIRQLVHLLGDTYYGARMPAAASLAKLDSIAVVQAIRDSMTSENPLIGNLGCEVLGHIGSSAALDLLTEQAYSSNPQRRAHAALALIVADSTDSRNFRMFYLAFEKDLPTRLKVESAISAVKDGRAESQ